MFTQTLNFCVKTVVLVILLDLGLNSLTNDKLEAQSESFSAEKTKAEFIPPKGSGIPKDPTTAGGTRTNCNEVYSCLIPLVPVTATNRLDYYPSTVSERPTFYISLPRTSGTATFTLYQHLPSEIKKIYRFSFPVKTAGGLVSIPLSPSSPALQNDHTYEWTLSLNNNEPTKGFVRRVHLNPNLSQKISTAKPLEKLAIYAAEGIWYDSVSTLAELRTSQPYDQKIFAEWSVFLKSANINKEMITRNFSPCCQVEN